MNKINCESPLPTSSSRPLALGQQRLKVILTGKRSLKKQLSVRKTCQNGLSRIPVPKGENGFTFAHIRASFKEIVDFPSSRKNTGPCTVRVKGREDEIMNLQYVFKLPETDSR